MKSQIEKLQERTKVNTEMLAQEFYKLIPEDEKICMTLGMLPAKFMEMFEGQVEAKFEKECYSIRKFYKETFEGMDDYLEEAMKECDDYVSKNTKKTVRDISIRLIGIATEKGLCKV